MSRLPVPGSDGNTWGTILNDFLSVSLNSDGTINSSSAAPFVTITSLKTSAYTANANEFVPVDTTGGSVTITLPTAPADGTLVGIKMVGLTGTNTITLACGGSDVLNKTGGSTTATVSVLNQSINYRYKASSAIWYGIAGDIGLTGLDALYLRVVNNLSDITSQSSARTNLGLGSLATLSNIDLTANVGTTILPIANGGTGSATQNFVDLTTVQTIASTKTFSGQISINASANFVNSGVFRQAATARTANVTLATTSASHQSADATAGSFTITLPASTSSGFTYVIPKIDASANTVTVVPPSGGTINGRSSVVLSNQGDTISVATTATSGVYELISLQQFNPVIAGTPTFGSPLAITSGGTGSATQNFVDLSTAQASIGGNKTWTGATTFSGNTIIGGTTGSLQYGAPSARTSSVTINSGSGPLQMGNATSAAFAITLFATTTPGITFTFIKIDSSTNALSVTASSGGSIAGASTIALANQWDNITIQSTTTSGVWSIVSSPTQVSGGALNLTNSTSNAILWNANGLAAPTFTTRSAGTKLVLYPAISGTTSDYAMGVASNTFWQSISAAIAINKFAWYGGTTAVMTLDGTGALVTASTIIAGGQITATAGARITPRVTTQTSTATPTMSTDTTDFYSLTALATAVTSFTTNLSGTPQNAQKLWISITDNGTARAIAWGASFEASTVPLPTTTVASTRVDIAFIWNTVTSKWRCVGVS